VRLLCGQADLLEGRALRVKAVLLQVPAGCMRPVIELAEPDSIRLSASCLTEVVRANGWQQGLSPGDSLYARILIHARCIFVHK
jgi:hypothetical protein